MSMIRRILTKTFKNVVALDKFNFEMEKGTLTALIGADGAGKSTFIRLIAGLITLTSGELQVLGLNVLGNEQKIQEKISYMPKRFGLYEDLTIWENMTFYADLQGVKKRNSARKIYKITRNDWFGTIYGAFGRKIIGRHETKARLGV